MVDKTYTTKGIINYLTKTRNSAFAATNIAIATGQTEADIMMVKTIGSTLTAVIELLEGDNSSLEGLRKTLPEVHQSRHGRG